MLSGVDFINHWSKVDLLKAFRLFEKKWEDKITHRGIKLFNNTLDMLKKNSTT